MSDPISVSLIGGSLFRKLSMAAQIGALVDTKAFPPVVSQIDVPHLFLKSLSVPDGGGAFTIVILNGLDKPLKKIAEFPDTGVQKGYPAVTDFGKHASRPDEVPAARPDPSNPGSFLYGLGLYTYDSTDSISQFNFSCKGAMALSAGDDDTTIAIRWQTAWGWIHPTVAACANLPDKYKDLADFYKTAPDGQDPVKSLSPKVNVDASLIWYRDQVVFERGHIIVWVQDPSK
jgi:hypothetical protein